MSAKSITVTSASDDSPAEPPVVVPTPSKTPFYQATQAERYQRQALIKQIQGTSKRKLLCYVSGIYCAIDRDDAVPFVDMLHNVAENTAVDLLLHTGGGDMDVAEKLIAMVRQKVGTAELRIIVPDFAKSAGTLMVLGADRVLMSDSSELGPIDPQIVLSDGKGNRIRHSVQNHIDAYNEHCERLRKNPDDVASQILLSKMEPATVRMFQGAMKRSRKVAEDLLTRGMFRGGRGNSTLTTTTLLDTDRWPSHGQMISWQDANSADIALLVDYVKPDSTEWQELWQLYCLQRLAVGNKCKLYESDYSSLVMEGIVL